MAKKTQPVQEEKVPVNNEQRMEALEEQKRNLEASYQKVLAFHRWGKSARSRKQDG